MSSIFFNAGPFCLNKIFEWVLNRDHVDHKHGALITRPRCRQIFSHNDKFVRSLKVLHLKSRFQALIYLARESVSIDERG